MLGIEEEGDGRCSGQAVGGTIGGEGLVAEAVDEEATIRVRGLVSQ